jgi:hypothetical protein
VPFTAGQALANHTHVTPEVSRKTRLSCEKQAQRSGSRDSEKADLTNIK